MYVMVFFYFSLVYVYAYLYVHKETFISLRQASLDFKTALDLL